MFLFGMKCLTIFHLISFFGIIGLSFVNYLLQFHSLPLAMPILLKCFQFGVLHYLHPLRTCHMFVLFCSNMECPFICLMLTSSSMKSRSCPNWLSNEPYFEQINVKILCTHLHNVFIWCPSLHVFWEALHVCKDFIIYLPYFCFQEDHVVVNL